MWLNDLFWGIRNTFVGKYQFLVTDDHLLRSLNSCGQNLSTCICQILQKIQAGVRPPPILAMPVFWELLVRQPIPNGGKYC